MSLDAIRYVFYAIFLVGVLIVAMPSLKSLIQMIRINLYISKYGAQADLSKMNTSSFDEHLTKLLRTTLNITNKNAAFYFKLISLVILVTVFILARQIIPAKMSLFLAAILAIMPYVIIRVSLETRRHKGSHEGDALIAELLNQYRLNTYKMEEAIEAAAVSLEDAPISQKLLLKLARDVKVARNDREILEALNEFEYNYRTNWSIVLKNNMFFALSEGIEVTEALKDLMESIAKARKIIEFTRRQNNESSNMLKYLAPATYGLTIWCAVKYFNFTIGKFFSYQFETEQGLTFFMYFLVSYIASIGLAIFYQSKKMDL